MWSPQRPEISFGSCFLSLAGAGWGVNNNVARFLSKTLALFGSWSWAFRKELGLCAVMGLLRKLSSTSGSSPVTWSKLRGLSVLPFLQMENRDNARLHGAHRHGHSWVNSSPCRFWWLGEGWLCWSLQSLPPPSRDAWLVCSEP